MPWSTQMEEACQSLLNEDKVETDRTLVALTRLAKIIVGASEVLRRVTEEPNTAPYASLAIPSLILSLDTLKSTLTAEQLLHSEPISIICQGSCTHISARHCHSIRPCRRSLHIRACLPSSVLHSNHSNTFIRFDPNRPPNRPPRLLHILHPRLY